MWSLRNSGYGAFLIAALTFHLVAVTTALSPPCSALPKHRAPSDSTGEKDSARSEDNKIQECLARWFSDIEEEIERLRSHNGSVEAAKCPADCHNSSRSRLATTPPNPQDKMRLMSFASNRVMVSSRRSIVRLETL